MEGAEQIRETLEKTEKTVSARPAAGQAVAITKVRLRPGLACDVEDGPWRFSVAMAERMGGNNEAPNPGVYGRAALGSCLAVGYQQWAARLGVPIDALEVEVQADYDVRGQLGIATDVAPGYAAMRYIVTVESQASEEEIHRVLDTADRFSPWRDLLARAVPLEREVRLATARP